CARLDCRSGFWLSVGMATRRARSLRKSPASKYFSMDWMASSRVDMSGDRDETDAGDLGGYTETHGRTPLARAGADVDPHETDLPQARGERLLEAHEEVPGPEL